MNEQQEIPFELMIRKMVAYEPREPATMAEVVGCWSTLERWARKKTDYLPKPDRNNLHQISDI